MASEVNKAPEFVESEMHEQPIVDNEQYIVRVRKYLLVLLFIQWFIFFFILVVGIYSTTPIPKGEVLDELLWWTPMMTIVLYYTIGLLAAYTYHRTILFIFATVGVALFIALCFIVGYIMLAILAIGTAFGSPNEAFQLTLIIVLIFAPIATIAIISLRFAFDLSKSLRTKEYSMV